MMGTKLRDFAPLPNLSLEELVPKDNFYRRLQGALDLSFVRDLVEDLYAACGRPSVDPVVFFKLQLVLFFEDLRSERQLMEIVADRLSIRWYLGYDLNEPLPDHSSLTRIRERYGLEIFRGFFERIVETCFEAGLVWGEELYFDSTKVEANAAVGFLAPRWAVEAHLGELFDEEGKEEESLAAGETSPALAALPIGYESSPSQGCVLLSLSALLVLGALVAFFRHWVRNVRRVRLRWPLTLARTPIESHPWTDSVPPLPLEVASAKRISDRSFRIVDLLRLAGADDSTIVGKELEMLGHASIAITLDTYSHVLPSMQNEAAKALEDALS